DSARHRTTLRERLVLGRIDRLAGHAQIQCVGGRAFYERSFSIGASRRGVRAHDEWQSAFPRRSRYRRQIKSRQSRQCWSLVRLRLGLLRPLRETGRVWDSGNKQSVNLATRIAFTQESEIL